MKRFFEINQYHNFLIIFLFFIFIIMRLVYPLADPPAKDIKCFGVYLTDEGFRVLSARDRVALDLPYNSISMLNKDVTFFPVIHLIYFFTFKIFGVGFLQARMTSIFWGILSLLIFYFILKRIFSKEISTFCFYLFGINHIVLFYTRLALAETIFIFFVLLSLYFSIIATNKKIPYLISGLINGLTIFIKPHSIPFVISNLFALIKNFNQNLKKSIVKMILFLFGFIISLIFVLSIIIITRSTELFYRGASEEILERITLFTDNLLRNFLIFPKFNVYAKSPIQAYLGILFIYFVALKIIKRFKYSFLEILSILFVSLTCIMIAFFIYQPIRYYLILIPIFIIGFGILLNQTYTLFLKFILKKMIAFVSIGYFVILNLFWLLYLIFSKFSLDVYIQNFIISFTISLPLIVMIFFLDKNYWEKFNKTQVILSSIITFLFIFFMANVTIRDSIHLFIEILNVNSIKFFYAFNFIYPFFILIIIIPFILFLYSECKNGMNYSKTSIIIIMLLFLSSFFDIYAYTKWIKFKGFTLYNASREITEITENKGVVFGRGAPTLSIENKLIASSSIHFLPEYVLFFKNRNIPIYLLFSNWQEYGLFIKTYNNTLSFYGVKNYIFLKEFKVLENYDKYSDLLLFYVSFY